MADLALTENQQHSMAVLVDHSKEPYSGYTVEGVNSAEGIKPSTDSIVCPLSLENEKHILGGQDYMCEGCCRNLQQGSQNLNNIK